MKYYLTRATKPLFRKKLLKLNLFQKRMFTLSLFLFFLASMVTAQSRKITGKITDPDSGNPLSGVSITVEGTSIGTTTSTEGNYSIDVPSGREVLVVSYVGFVTQRINVTGKSVIDVFLVSESKELEKVVVIGYGTQRQRDLTGSVSSISGAQIEKVPITNLDQAIQGRSAGVNVINNDGAPGAGVQIQIRGIGSLGNNDPLYVVDGYPLSSANAINPNDIASIEILKDASATAIYGNRAANGVVIITTKRGRKDGVQVEFDAYASLQAKPKMLDVLNAEEWAKLANELAPVDGFTPLPEWGNPSSLRNLDWQNEVFQTGLRHNYNISLRGGSSQVQSAFSIGYLGHEGIVIGSEFKRYNVGLNLDYNALSWLKSSSSVKYTRGTSKIPFGTGGHISGTQGIMHLAALPPTMTANQFTDQIEDDNGNFGFYNPTYFYLQYLRNPVHRIKKQDTKYGNNNILGTTSLEATVLKDFKVKTNFGVNFTENSGYYFLPSDTRQLEQYGRSGNPDDETSTYSQSAANNFDWVWENTLAYSKVFGDHSIDFVGGISAQEGTSRQIGTWGKGSVNDDLRDVGSIISLRDRYGNQQTYSLASQFGRINYKFMDRYLFTGTVRRDGSSKFARGNQYGVFPSGSVAWKVSEEPFFKNVKSINDLKLRASYGEVGNQGSIGLFQYLSRYTSGGPQSSNMNAGYIFGGAYQQGIQLAALPNPGLKWETTKMTNIGFDLTMLNRTLTLTVDYYKKESEDFLLDIPVPGQTGFLVAARNVGSIRNSGIEVTVDYRKVKTDFSYGINANLSTINNKLLSLTNDLSTISNLELSAGAGDNTWTQISRTRIGGPIGEFYGYKTDGIFQTQAEVDALNVAAEAKYGAGSTYQSSYTVAGDRKFVDVNGDGVVTESDQVSLGSPIPKFFGSLNLDASYRSFDVNIFFYGVSGNKLLNYQQAKLESFGGPAGQFANVTREYYLNRWTPSNPSNRFARATKDDYNGNGSLSDVYVEDGSYLRLRSIQVGYTVPSALTNRISISRVRVYVSAQNLFTITKYSGRDPEIGLPAGNDGSRTVVASGLDVGNYPSSRYFTLGFNLTL